MPVGKLQRLVENGGEITRIIRRARRRLVGNLLGLDMVAAAQINGINPHLARGGVDQPLHIVIAFRTPGAAIGRHRHGVGEHAARADLHQRRAIARVHVLHDIEGGEQRPDLRHVAAKIAKALAAQG